MRGILTGQAACLLLLLAGSARGGGDMSPDELRSHLSDRFQAHYIAPYVAGDTDAWLEIFDEDIVALHDGLPALTGKAAVREFAEVVAGHFVIEKMDAVVDEVRRGGDWAWTRGRYDTLFTARSPDAPPGVAGPRQGKFLLMWERQSSGDWLVILDMGNGTQQPSATTQP
ncbi:MAG: nuclear transport factor 2 family protein [Gammaproteobacteria bacterium]|nr:nuclear transport factor 2 family protein [Gammaproteobacteria bacterium]